MASAWVGLGCLLVFALAQAVRDAYLGNVFQSTSFFLVAVLAFGGSTLVFGIYAWMRHRDQIRVLGRHRALFAALNVTTALAWMLYLFALKTLEPAIVNTLYTGIGAVAVLALSGVGVAMAKRAETGALEKVGHGGVVLSLFAIAIVALIGQSGMAGADQGLRILALAGAVVGGVVITISHMIAGRLGDLGVGSVALMGLRFPATFLIAIVMEFWLGDPALRGAPPALPFLALAAFALIVVPSFFLQLGIARTTPLTVNVMRALGPIFVFAVQQLDGRLRFSGATLACILAFMVFAMLTSGVRAWAATRRPLKTGC